MASAAAKAPWHLYIIKLLQGFAEASTFVGAVSSLSTSRVRKLTRT